MPGTLALGTFLVIIREKEHGQQGSFLGNCILVSSAFLASLLADKPTTYFWFHFAQNTERSQGTY